MRPQIPIREARSTDALAPAAALRELSEAPVEESSKAGSASQGSASQGSASQESATGGDERKNGDLEYQDRVLPGVSRTFALTIPQLPPGLREAVTNGYLLCRIADTIEDEPALERDEKEIFQERFVRVVGATEDPDRLASDLAPKLTGSTLATERELIVNLARVVRVTHDLRPVQREALERCVRIMCDGMSRFQAIGPAGVRDVDELHEYCYFVAGVVGEMLTDLFCAHSDQIAANGSGMRRLAVSFGQGLQLTNILKDIWDDLDRGACWLPRDLFGAAGIDLASLDRGQYSEPFGECLQKLVGIAHAHVRNALDYTLYIPAHERGIRKFCLWALGMAILSLRKVSRHPDFQSSREVKITRGTVKRTIFVSNLAIGSDRSLRGLFGLCARGVPLEPIDAWMRDYGKPDEETR